MRFEKWQALGNDYLIVEEDEVPFALTPARVRRLCEGHLGVFADGVLLLSRSQDPGLAADLRIFNPDGSEAELSGNGAREAILYLRHRGWTDRDVFSIGTVAGEIRPTITGPDTCTVDMGNATVTSTDFPTGPPDGRGRLRVGEETRDFQHVSIGNPQCAIGVASEAGLMALDLSREGPPIEGDPRFPNRTNVSWYTQIGPGRIRARIFERGVGETLSSGTGACGAAIGWLLSGDRARRSSPGTQATGGGVPAGGGVAAGDRREGVPAGDGGGDDRGGDGGRSVTVVLDGGQLEVVVGDDLHVDLTGWAVPVFEGRLSEAFLKELYEIE